MGSLPSTIFIFIFFFFFPSGGPTAAHYVVEGGGEDDRLLPLLVELFGKLLVELGFAFSTVFLVCLYIDYILEP